MSVGYKRSIRLASALLGSSFAATCSSGRATSFLAAARNLFVPGRTSPLALHAAEATTLGSLSRSALCSGPRSAPSSALYSAPISSAPGFTSLSSPPAPICYEAAGTSETDTNKAAATIEPASPGRLSSALGRGCSSAHGTCVDQPASITSTASQALLQYEDGTHGMAASNEHCHTVVLSCVLSCNPNIGRAERSSHKTLVPATISFSQARTVTLR